MELKIVEMLGAGGDLATIALFFLMWRFDRRLLMIETKMEKDSHG